MQVKVHVAIGVGSVIGGVLALLASHFYLRQDCPLMPPIQLVAPAPKPAPEPPPVPAVAVAEPEFPPDHTPITVESPGCKPSPLIPASYVETLTPVEEKELAAFVENWVHGGRSQMWPSIEYRRGAVYIESEEDRGDDGPYPRSAQPEAERVCGTKSLWMMSSLQKTLSYQDVTCCANTCSYGGMEYAPNGTVIFRKLTGENGSSWVLDTWFEYYSATLGEEYVDRNVKHVRSSLLRLADTRCAGEPAGWY